MKEKYEQFVDYFKRGGSPVYNVSEKYGKVSVQVGLGYTKAEVSYDGYMVSIIHYIAPVRETSSLLYNKVNNLDIKFRSTAKIGINIGDFNGGKYLYTVFAYLGNGDPYSDLENMFDKFDRAYDLIENDVKDLLNYL